MAKDKIITGIDVGSSKIATLISTINEDGRIHLIGVAATHSKGLKKDKLLI